MPEVRYEVEPVGIYYHCDHCETGIAVCAPPKEAFVYDDNVVRLKHFCDKCGTLHLLPEHFPTVRYVFKRRLYPESADIPETL